MKNALVIIGIFVLVGLVAAIIGTLPSFFTAVRGATSSIILSADGGDTWFPLEQTEQTKDLERANIISLSFNPTETRIVYAGTNGRGLFKSRDGGATWARVPAQNNVLATNATVWDIGYGNTITSPEGFTEVVYVAVSQNDIGQVLKTTNGGQTFEQVYSTAGEGSVIFVEPDPINRDVLWVGTTEGLLVQSRDAGATWQKIFEFDAVPHALVRNPANGVEVFVATFENGIAYSPDAGATWQNRTDALQEFRGAKKVTTLTQDPVAPRTLYMATAFGLLRSDNFGRTWNVVPLTIPEPGTVSAVAVAPTARNVLYASAGRNLYISNDAGVTWRVRHLAINRIVTEVTPHPTNPAFILAGTHK